MFFFNMIVEFICTMEHLFTFFAFILMNLLLSFQGRIFLEVTGTVITLDIVSCGGVFE